MKFLHTSKQIQIKNPHILTTTASRMWLSNWMLMKHYFIFWQCCRILPLFNLLWVMKPKAKTLNKELPFPSCSYIPNPRINCFSDTSMYNCSYFIYAQKYYQIIWILLGKFAKETDFFPELDSNHLLTCIVGIFEAGHLTMHMCTEWRV